MWRMSLAHLQNQNVQGGHPHFLFHFDFCSYLIFMKMWDKAKSKYKTTNQNVEIPLNNFKKKFYVESNIKQSNLASLWTTLKSLGIIANRKSFDLPINIADSDRINCYFYADSIQKIMPEHRISIFYDSNFFIDFEEKFCFQPITEGIVFYFLTLIK